MLIALGPYGEASVDQAPIPQLIDGVAHFTLFQTHDWVTARLLIAGLHKGVQRQRIAVRCRALLLHQAAEDARLYGIEQGRGRCLLWDLGGLLIHFRVVSGCW